jgi:peroxiredoxin
MNKKYRDDDDKKRLIDKFNSSQSASAQIYINFGKNHPDSYLGLDILYRNRTRVAKDSLALIYQKLSPAFTETARGRALKIFLYEELAQKGKPVPDFGVKTLTGKDFSLSSLKGTYVYLSFWSAGCYPCRMENRLLSKSLKDLPKNLSLVNFSVDKNPKAWAGASEADNIWWHNVSDLEGENGSVKTGYNVQAIPASFLINREGVIIETFLGYDEDLVTKLKELIAKEDSKGD